MATFIEHTKEHIVFTTTIDDRAPGLLFVLLGSIFVAGPVSMLPVPLAKVEALPLALLLALLLAGFGMVGHGLKMLLKSEWLVLDLLHRSYVGRRGLLFLGELLAGPIEDFEAVRFVSEFVRTRHGGYRRWFVAWAWRDKSRRPFRVDRWGRLKSFRLAHRLGDGDRLNLFLELGATAKAAGLPLEIPKQCFDDLVVEGRDWTRSPATWDPSLL